MDNDFDELLESDGDDDFNDYYDVDDNGELSKVPDFQPFQPFQPLQMNLAFDPLSSATGTRFTL